MKEMTNAAVAFLLALVWSAAVVDAFAVIPFGRNALMGKAVQTQISMQADSAYGEYGKVITNLELAGKYMKTAIESREKIGQNPQADPSEVAMLKQEEEKALAAVKKIIDETEDALGDEYPEPSLVKAINELDKAVTDMEQAVDIDTATILDNAENELETAISDLEKAVESETLEEAGYKSMDVDYDVIKLMESENPSVSAVPDSSSLVGLGPGAHEKEALESIVSHNTGAVEGGGAAMDGAVHSVLASTGTEFESFNSVAEKVGTPVQEAVQNAGGSLLASATTSLESLDPNLAVDDEPWVDSIVNAAESLLEASSSVVDTISSLH